MKRDSIQSYRLPFTLDEVLDELRQVIWCTAAHVAVLGYHREAVTMVGGQEDADFVDEYSAAEHFMGKLDVSGLDMTGRLARAYDFAFQVGDPLALDGSEWLDLEALSLRSVRGDWSGGFSPLLRDESKLMHVCDMTHGRMMLMTDGALTIRHLSLLANMTEAAVRSALSSEGIKTEGRPASLPNDVAEKWLAGRRGFVPTSPGRAAADFATAQELLAGHPFPQAFQALMIKSMCTIETLSLETGVPIGQVNDLLAGRLPDLSVKAIVAIANRLGVETQAFAAKMFTGAFP